MSQFIQRIFDEQGNNWALGDELKRYIGTRRPDENLARYCVNKLGYVLADTKPSGTVFVSFSEDIVGPVALVALLQWLHDQPMGRFVFYQGGLNERPWLIPSLHEARKHIGALLAASTPNHAFEITELAATASPFRKTWQVAEEIHVADIPEALKLRLLDKLFDGRFTLSRRHSETGDFTISAVGSAILDYQFADRDRYTTFRDMHDRDYGQWIADGLKRLSTNESSRFQLVTAPLKFLAQPNRVLHRYSRLLQAPNINGSQRLLTASVVC
jgi:hypothetical protein